MKILLPFGVSAQMERDGFGSQPTIRKALRGEYNEWNDDERKRALRIRKRALEMGGVESVAPVVGQADGTPAVARQHTEQEEA